MSDESVVSIERALSGSFTEIKITRKISDDVTPEIGLGGLLQSARKVISAAIRVRNCFKFGLTVDGIFQVNSIVIMTSCTI